MLRQTNCLPRLPFRITTDLGSKCTAQHTALSFKAIFSSELLDRQTRLPVELLARPSPPSTCRPCKRWLARSRSKQRRRRRPALTLPPPPLHEAHPHPRRRSRSPPRRWQWRCRHPTRPGIRRTTHRPHRPSISRASPQSSRTSTTSPRALIQCHTACAASRVHVSPLRASLLRCPHIPPRQPRQIPPRRQAGLQASR
jgi:hypothetical protein